MNRENRQTIDILNGEKWWGGNVRHGLEMPYKNFEQTLMGCNDSNQSMPLLLSNKGRYLYSDQPFTFKIDESKIIITDIIGLVKLEEAGKTLKEAYLDFTDKYAKPSGKIPDELLFKRPQYNTWIELNYNQNEKEILSYAEKLVKEGYPPGVLMIDDTWQENYGVWEFNSRRFENPKGMVEKLHILGFKVMLWVCPFVSADSPEGRHLTRKGALVLEIEEGQKNSKPALVRWWNGASYCLDLSNPVAEAWFRDRLKYLQVKYGVDGFKFDAGDSGFYNKKNYVFHQDWHANDHMESFAKIGLDFPLNELRACWKLANQPIAQRLYDKKHDWNDIKELIPALIAQGLMGYAFGCPDMIGGGEFFNSFENLKTIDPEFFVRYAQLSALMPMMQYSSAPYRVLDKKHNQLCLEAAKLRRKMGEEILALAKESAKTGEPMLRSLEYSFPGNDYWEIKDQFLLGESILIAPVIVKGQTSREVIIPEGNWERQDIPEEYTGDSIQKLEVPLANLCWFRKKYS